MTEKLNHLVLLPDADAVAPDSPPSEYLTKLRVVIEATHGCRATHVESVPVPVKQDAPQPAGWDGMVQVFELALHPKATRCYAWGHRLPDGEWDVTTVLSVSPTKSPEAAVRWALSA